MLNRRALLSAGAAIAPAMLLTMGTSRVARAAGCTLRRGDVIQWINRYSAAWRNKDADGAALLFTEDAIYQALPGVASQTFVGRAAIHDYWAGITAGQSGVTILHGEPIVQGARALIELWVTMQVPALNPDPGHWVTLIESNVLTFDDTAHVSHNVEYWNLQTGALTPPEGWGEP